MKIENRGELINIFYKKSKEEVRKILEKNKRKERGKRSNNTIKNNWRQRK